MLRQLINPFVILSLAAAAFAFRTGNLAAWLLVLVALIRASCGLWLVKRDQTARYASISPEIQRLYGISIVAVFFTAVVAAAFALSGLLSFAHADGIALALVTLAIVGGLAAESAILFGHTLSHTVAHRHGPALTWIITACGATALLLLLSTVALIWFDVPIAINARQIIALGLIGLLPLAAGFTLHLNRQAATKFTHFRANAALLKQQAGWATLIALVTFGNYLWYFERQVLSPRFIDHALPQFRAALSLTLVTLLVCLIVRFVVVHGRIDRLTAYVMGFLVAALYLPPLQLLFGLSAIGVLDWFWVLLSGGIVWLGHIASSHAAHYSRESVHRLYSSRR